MRVTSSMYYKSVMTDNSKTQEKLFDVNKQISSGLKIQYAGDDVPTFTETMRLDNEIATLKQVKESTQNGFKMSNQADVIMNEFETATDRMRTLLLNAANDTHSETSLNAIAVELRGIEKNFKELANTSINGQYLFSGSAVNVKPINDDGTYSGNDVAMNAFLGSKSEQQYNLTGADLFLGEEVSVKREVTTNVVQGLNVPASSTSELSGSNTMAEFMGNSPSGNHYFYVRGAKSDGTAFNKKITLTNSDTIDTLLSNIGNAFGNGATDVVNVSINSNGQITVEDKLKGSSKLDFHMVGATDFSGGAAANVTNIDNLDTGDTSYTTALAGSSLYVREFVQSGFTQADTVSAAGNNIEGLLYDRTKFAVSGDTVSSNVAQINKTTNAFATPSTKLLDVASGTTLNGQQFIFSGKNVAGAAFTAQIDFANGGSTFSLDGGTTNYTIFNVDTPRTAVDSDKMTYQQLMDVMNMITTNNIPATVGTATDYDTAIDSSSLSGTTSLTYDGKLKFNDLTAGSTKVEMALHDSTSGSFAAASDSSVMTFNTNNALTVRDPKTDFFKTLNEMITAVEDFKKYPDSSTGEIRNVGVENAITMMDDLQNHVYRSHSLVGANSNTLSHSLDRTDILEISTQTLRSSVIDTDLAEASLTLTQLTNNFQAMLSTVGKISQLTLVNYL